MTTPARNEMRVYRTNEVAGFRRNSDEFGPWSNMYPMRCQVGSECFSTSEGLYQALRLPDNPAAQREIQAAHNGMAAKIVAYRYQDQFRPDWHQKGIKVNCMRFALWSKFAIPENRKILMDLLNRRGERPLVEISAKDDQWGAKPQPNGTLVGMNMLGRLCMEIGMKLAENPAFPVGAALPKVPNLKLFGKEIDHPYWFGPARDNTPTPGSTHP